MHLSVNQREGETPDALSHEGVVSMSSPDQTSSHLMELILIKANVLVLGTTTREMN